MSRYDRLFPGLKKLKIHLEQHSEVAFLRSLDADFCKQIEELWINTKNDSEEEQDGQILAKFRNLKSLELAPSSRQFYMRSGFHNYALAFPIL